MKCTSTLNSILMNCHIGSFVTLSQVLWQMWIKYDLPFVIFLDIFKLVGNFFIAIPPYISFSRNTCNIFVFVCLCFQTVFMLVINFVPKRSLETDKNIILTILLPSCLTILVHLWVNLSYSLRFSNVNSQWYNRA